MATVNGRNVDTGVTGDLYKVQNDIDYLGIIIIYYDKAWQLLGSTSAYLYYVIRDARLRYITYYIIRYTH